MKFVFACGASAGHINPALAVAGKIRELMPESEILFVGTPGGIEMKLVPLEGYDIKTVEITSIHRSLAPKDVVHNVKTLRNVVRSAHQVSSILKEFRPDAVIGTGGYVCYPVVHEAAKASIPTFVHESNAVPGLTTKMLSGCADRIMVGFEGCVAAYKDKKKVVVTGTPVRGDFLKYDRASARKELGIGNDEKLLVSFWGSLGASHMNGEIEKFIVQNENERAFRHIHATGIGEEYASEVKARICAKLGKEELSMTDLRPYIYDMPRVMAAADVVLCRAGASTLSELTAIGKAAILVPSPYVTNNHQEKNAVLMRDAGGAIMLTENEASAAKLFETAKELFADKAGLREMSAKMKAEGNVRAADTIVGEILQFIAEKNA